MKKCFFLVLIILCFTVSLFAKDVYSDADAKTKAVLANVDELIEKRQYQSAFDELRKADNEFLLAKKVEVTIYYFAKSTMHQMFAFKNLSENETLYDVRIGDGTFNMVLFDPVKAINEFVAKNGEKPILNYALGLYYNDVKDCYGDQWFIPSKELIDKTVFYLQKAYDSGCYDEYSLSFLATGYYRQGDYNSAIKVYEAKLKEFEFTATDNYHYGIILWFTDNGKKGAEFVKKSIEGYKDSPVYQSDAYLVVARIYISIADYKTAEEYLKKCGEAFPDDYRIAQFGIGLYARQNQKKKALDAAYKLFDKGHAKPAVSRMIMEQYTDAGKTDYLLDFFKQAVKKYSNDSIACENLYFHYSDLLLTMGKKSEAAEMATKAREFFEKNGHLTPEIDEILQSVISEKN